MSLPRNLGLLFAAVTAANTFAQHGPSTKIESPNPPSGTWRRERHTLPTAEVAPKIDGEIDDACWKTAKHGLGFFRFLSKDPIQEQSEVWICADKDKLYFAIHCLESRPETILAKETQRNGNLNQDDRVVVLIDSQSMKRNVSEFWVNARGTQMQSIEGGTADNQAWQGDWSAATKRTNDGWNVEIAIPFSLLRYPKGAKSFGMFVGRKKSNETNFMVWPYVPPQGDTGSIAQYLADFDGINPPTYAARPTISPYMLSTTGQGTSARFGLDIKYPLSTTLTGLATIKPDFETVEGAVQDVSFSYTEKYVPDRRPFFAEGGNFLDDSFLFYSQRIPDVDYGLKVMGKQGPTTIGLLAATSTLGNKQTAEVATFDQEIGQYSGFGGTFLSNHQTGSNGQIAQVRGSYGWAKGLRNVRFSTLATQAWLDNGRQGHNIYARAQTYAGKGQLNGSIYYSATDAEFDNPLGLISEVDSKGVGISLNRFDIFDKGAVEQKSFYAGGDSFDHMDGSFFHRNFYIGAEYSLRKGYGFGVNGSVGQRDAFHDRSITGFVSWNQRSLLSRGYLSVESGQRENKPYRFTSLGQGFPLGRALSFNLSVGELELGTDTQTQTILSGTYRIDPLQSFGGRMISQDGKTNVYLSYGRRTRKGNDLFILLGDPNTPTTRKSITLKMVWSL